MMTEINIKITVPVAVGPGAKWQVEADSQRISGIFDEHSEPILTSENNFLTEEFTESLIEYAVNV